MAIESPVGSDVGLPAATGELATHPVDRPTGLGYLRNAN